MQVLSKYVFKQIIYTLHTHMLHYGMEWGTYKDNHYSTICNTKDCETN